MHPSERFQELIKLLRFCGACCGADIFEPGYHINRITYLVIFSITIYFAFTIYTISVKFSEDWKILLESLCMVGSVLQGISKLLTAICNTQSLKTFHQSLLDIYLKYEETNSNYRNLLEKCLDKIVFVVKVFKLSYVVVTGCIFLMPFIMFAITGRRYLVMQFLLPGLQTDTDFGYFATVSFQSFCLFFGSFGNFAGDILCLMFVANSLIFGVVFDEKIKELNDGIDLKSVVVIQEQLKDVLRFHQEFSNYCEKINRIFFWHISVQIVTSGVSIIFTLFIIFVGQWIGSYTYLALSFLCLYMYCGLGTMVEILNEAFITSIYDIKWYALNVKEQKVVLFMLMRSQKASNLTVGGITPLNVSTALQVTKTVYSFMMMLLNFIDKM